MRRLDALGIDYDVTPGVPRLRRAAAILKSELTLPDVSQTIIPHPHRRRGFVDAGGRETLAELGRSRATLAIHLSVRNIHKVVAELTPHYGRRLPGGRGLSRRLA